MSQITNSYGDILDNKTTAEAVINALPTTDESNWQKYICLACGLIYDEAIGDIDSGLAPGTRFADIPDDWVCPLCGVTKQDFELFVPRAVNISQSQNLSHSMAATHHFDVVILGGGMAGWAVAEAVRSIKADLPMLMITACEANRYHKPELSIAFSKGLTADKMIKSTGANAAAELNFTLLANTYVLNIDSNLKQISTTRGIFTYEKLVFATGASSFIPPALPAKFCWRINHLDSFSKLHKALGGQKKRLVIVGAGMIGTELSEDLARSGHEVRLIDRAAYPLQGLLPEMAAKLVAASLHSQGVTYLAERTVTDLQKNATGDYTLFSTDTSGNLYQDIADEVIVATGLTVSSRLPERAGLDFNPRTGIKVDATTLQSSVPDIYALGDCIDIDGYACRFIAPIYAQASTIAAEVTGQIPLPYNHSSPVIRLKTKGVSVMIFGKPNQQYNWVVASNDDEQLIMQQQYDGHTQAKIIIKQVKSA